MIRKGLKIDWGKGVVEYVAFDLDKGISNPEVVSTLEWWPDIKRFVPYTTTSTIKSSGKGRSDLSITYDARKNPNVPEGAFWGTSVVRIEQSSSFGIVSWHKNGKKKITETVRWSREDRSIKSKKIKNTIVVTKANRQQAMFRLALLGKYRCCAVTGEKTPSSLEAAHVVASASGGNEIIGNGVLLRADLHRLYDAGAFSITTDGYFIADGYDLSPYYRKLLREAKIPEDLKLDLFG